MSLARNAGRMSIAVFLSRILGLVREQVFAALFGAGYASDAYQIAFRIPNLLRDMFAEGAMSLAFVTVLNRTQDEEERKRIARQVMTALSFIVGLICMGIFFSAPWIVAKAAANFASVPGKIELTTRLTRLFSPFLYFASMAALAMGILNTLGSFFIPAMGSAAFNAGNIIIGGGLALLLAKEGNPGAAIWGFGIGTLVGGFLQWGVQWPTLRKFGYVPWAGLSGIFSPRKVAQAFRDPGFLDSARLMAPAILSIASVQITAYIGMTFASSLQQGSVSWINYSYRLIQFPMGVFGVALSQAAHPKLAQVLKAGRVKEFHDTIEQALVLSLLLALGSLAGLVVFREPIISLLYQHGHFNAQDTVMTAQCLAAYSVGLIAFIVNKIFVQVFYVLHKVWIPSVVSFVSILLSLGLNILFAKWLGPAGVPLSTALTSSVVMVTLFVVVRANGIPCFSAKSLRAIAAALAGCAGMAALAWLGLPALLLSLRVSHGFTVFATATLGSVAVAGLLYLAVLSWLTPEGRKLLDRLVGKLRKRS